MIHSARPTVSPVVNIVFAWNLFCYARFWKVGTDGRTDNMCENNDHYHPWLWVGQVDQMVFFSSGEIVLGPFLPCHKILRKKLLPASATLWNEYEPQEEYWKVVYTKLAETASSFPTFECSCVPSTDKSCDKTRFSGNQKHSSIIYSLSGIAAS